MNTPRLKSLNYRTTIMCAVSLCACTGALAQQGTATPSAPALWELGAFSLGVSQQAYPGSDQQVQRALALPFFIYRGETLRADRDTVGFRALKSSDFELDIGLAGAFGSNAELQARQGMRKLGNLVELGPRLKWSLHGIPGDGRWRVELPLRAVFDLNDGAAQRGFSVEPKLIFENQLRSGWAYSTSVSAILADRKLAQTFYGVTASEATAQRAAYSAQSGLVAWRLASTVSRSLGPDWRLFGFARLDTVAGAANESSPLVRQKTGGSVGVGLVYTWMRSERRASD